LVEVSAEQELAKEGCLSFLGLFVSVKRPARATVEYWDEKGCKQTASKDGLLGRAIQHEIDHLDGKTFLDRMSNLERSNALNKNKAAKRRLKATIKRLHKK
jgi:peptide deformylase